MAFIFKFKISELLEVDAFQKNFLQFRKNVRVFVLFDSLAVHYQFFLVCLIFHWNDFHISDFFPVKNHVHGEYKERLFAPVKTGVNSQRKVF